jgi:hypothetical protein
MFTVSKRDLFILYLFTKILPMKVPLLYDSLPPFGLGKGTPVLAFIEFII